MKISRQKTRNCRYYSVFCDESEAARRQAAGCYTRFVMGDESRWSSIEDDVAATYRASANDTGLPRSRGTRRHTAVLLLWVVLLEMFDERLAQIAKMGARLLGHLAADGRVLFEHRVERVTAVGYFADRAGRGEHHDGIGVGGLLDQVSQPGFEPVIRTAVSLQPLVPRPTNRRSSANWASSDICSQYETRVIDLTPAMPGSCVFLGFQVRANLKHR